MSLYGSIQMASNTLQAMQIGMHVVGNNIANANTPGYARERVLYTPAPVQKIGKLTLGLGVNIAGIVQGVDKFLESRLRDSGGDLASADVQDKVYTDLQSILGELSDTDVSTALSGFVNSIDQVVDHPEEISVRNLAGQAGKTLATTISTLSRRVTGVASEFSTQVQNKADEINSLTEQIRKLNLQIVTLEGGDASSNDAGGLRSQRSVALQKLAEIADIDTTESEAGAVNVTLAGDFLVFEGTRRAVTTELSQENGLTKATIKFADNGDLLRASSGELHGIYEARDTIAGGFLDKLDTFASALIHEFNLVYSQGQGASGFSTVTSQEAVTNPNAALDEAGLSFAPEHGTFNVLVYNTKTKLTETHTIPVNLNGLNSDTTLSSLAASLNAIDGVAAQVTSDNRLKISSDSKETQIAFEKDSSGVLASLGINTFFTGSSAADIGVNSVVLNDGSKFAAGRDGIGVDNKNALELVSLYDRGLGSLGGATITGAYDQLVNDTAQGATVAASLKDGYDVFQKTLEANAQGVSGVNIDEEAVDLVLLQRTYQASAKFISTMADLLDILVNL